MKKISIFKLFTFLLFLVSASVSEAQFTAQPLSFPTYTLGTTAVGPNFYANYVGVRLEVVSPSSVAGDKVHTQAVSSNGWTAILPVTTPIVDKQMLFPPDRIGCTAPPSDYYAGKVAILYRSTCQFSVKAYEAQQAGAIACIIIDSVPGQSPIGMSAGTYSTSVTIPVFMISKADGDPIYALWTAGTPDTSRVTITPWGAGMRNDLGFFPGGSALWHNTTIPYNQLLTASSNPAYMGLDGAYIANFGTNDEYNVKLKAVTTFYSGSSTPIVVHTDSVMLDTFKVSDSIYTMFCAPYNLPAISDTGHFGVTYTISSDSADENQADNTFRYYFTASNNVYCKSGYDFVNNIPTASLYEQSNASYYMWGNMYYVSTANSYVNSMQFSLVASASGPISISSTNNYLFQWNDGSGGQPMDSIIQLGEFQLIGNAVKVFSTTNPGDTSGGWWTVVIADSLGNVLNYLMTPGWYYLAPEVQGTSSGFYLACDGSRSQLPRVFGRLYNPTDGFLEYTSPVWGGGYEAGTELIDNPTVPLTPLPFQQTDFVNTVDSAVFNNQIGIVPSVSLITLPWAEKTNTVSKPVFDEFTLYPNPATDHITANISLPFTANEVSYTIIDNSAKFVSKEIHNNVKSEQTTINTANLASGNYYLVVVADGKTMFKKFTVVKK